MVMPMRFRFAHWILILALMIDAGLVWADVNVTVDRNPVRVNESFQLIFEADASVDGDPDFSPLQQHFQILNRSQGSNITIINGQYRRQLKWTLQVIPKQAGDFVLPSIQFGTEKSKLTKITVKPAGDSTGPGGEGLFLELSSEESSLYVQSQAVITLRLMSDSNISNYQLGDLAIEDMDVVIESLGDVKQYQTRLKNKSYLVLERQFALFPQQSGTLSIGPVLAEVHLGSRSRSIFDPFQTNAEVRHVRSKKISLEVMPKPDAFDAAHWFPSTGVELVENWQGDMNNIVAGEPITRIINLKAEGLTAAQLPDLTQVDVPGIKQYPDKPVFEDRRSAKGINALKQQRTAIIPTGAGRYVLPEIAISWWNISTGKQEVARIPERTLEVQRATAGDTAAEASPTTKDTANTGAVAGSESGRLWLWMSILFGSGWALSLALWWLSRRGYLARFRIPGLGKGASLSNTSRRLRRACLADDAIEARNILLDWANALGSRQFANLNQVTRQFGDPLKSRINRLSQSVYSERPEDWQGEKLWEICEQITTESMQSKRAKTGQGLESLNPEH